MFDTRKDAIMINKIISIFTGEKAAVAADCMG